MIEGFGKGWLIAALLIVLLCAPCGVGALSLEDVLGVPENDYPNVDELFGGAPDITMEKALRVEAYSLVGTLNGYTFADGETASLAAQVLADACAAAGFAMRDVGEEGASATLYTSGDRAMLVLQDPDNCRVYVLVPRSAAAPASQIQDNFIKVALDGETHVFAIDTVKVSGSEIECKAYAKNPLGKRSGYMRFVFAADTAPGSSPDPNTQLLLSYRDYTTGLSYRYQRTKNGNLIAGSNGKVTVLKRSDDWKHYEGAIEATLSSEGRDVALTDGTFSFTIQ